MKSSTQGARGSDRWVAVMVASALACSARTAESAHTAELSHSEKPAYSAVQKDTFGELGGRAVERYTLTNAHGLSLRVITYGATLTELRVPDRAGQLADVVLGFDRLEDYVQHSPFFGATVGRVANRIAHARFELGGKEYVLAANSGPHHLHGGIKGWDKVVWDAEPLASAKGASLQLTYVSHDGEEGYPGTVTAHAVFTLTDTDDLEIDMRATTDQPTLVNMAHHSYFNLGGHGSGPITEETLQLFAAGYTPATGSIPDGQVAPVQGTPFDFRQPKAVGRDLGAVGGTQVGFDHNWVVDGDPDRLRAVARLSDPTSGRVMTIAANQPGVQLYTGNHLKGTIGKGGVVYEQHAGLCLETQKFPNSINVPAWRDEVILSPGQTYDHQMRIHFSVE